MNLEAFLPNYPTFTDMFEWSDHNEFNMNLFKKKEFYELKLSSEAETPTLSDAGDPTSRLLNHQKIVARFLSSNTLYDELFLDHEAGSGKTCSAVGAIETNLREARGENTIQKALIILKSPGLVQPFIQQVLNVCTPKTYIPSDEQVKEMLKKYGEELSEEELQEQKQKMAFRELRKRYTITTHEAFYNTHLRDFERRKSVLSKLFSNHVIVIDEVHHLPSSMMYDAYHSFLHSLENRKILLMSGTPMRDDVSEIAKIMNLILPLYSQLPTGDAFSAEYFTGGVLKKESIPKLQRIVTGRVSYLRSVTNIQKEYMGDMVKGITSFPLNLSIMGKHQSNWYLTTYQNDTGFYDKAREASLFVFPDGSSGSNGFSRYLQQKRKNTPFRFTDEMRREFPRTKSENGKQRLDVVRRFSSKFANCIDTILSTPKQNCFVFSESIRGSGAIVFGQCLEQFGYKLLTRVPKKKTKGRFYTILSDRIGLDKLNAKSLIRMFNNPDNANGDYLHVLVGGRKVGEGFTFYNIQQIHILQPHWNLAVIDQAIARGIRFRSHRDLPPNTKTRVYLHAAILEPSSQTDTIKDSIDIQMYTVCQAKDRMIKQFQALLRNSSFDCALTYERNLVRNAENGSRECDYGDCIYRCSGVDLDTSYSLAPSGLDYNTYDLFYFKETQIEDIVYILQTIFYRHFFITLQELLEFFRVENRYITAYQLFMSLQQIISQHISLFNRYGYKCILKESNNIYFLSNSYYTSSYLSSYYVEKPALHKQMTFTEALRDVYSKQIPEQLEQICRLPFEQKKSEFSNLSLEVQELFLEQVYQYRELIDQSNPEYPFHQWILSVYGKYIVTHNEDAYSILLYSSRKRIRKFVESDSKPHEWIDVSPKLISEFLRIYVDKNEFKLFGKQLRNELYIVDFQEIPVDVNSRTSVTRALPKIQNLGIKCTTINIPKLVEYAIRLDVPVNLSHPAITQANQTQDELVIRMREFLATKKVPLNRIMGLSTKELKQMVYFYSLKRNMLCRHLLSSFQQLNLLYVL